MVRQNENGFWEVIVGGEMVARVRYREDADRIAWEETRKIESEIAELRSQIK